MPARLIAVLHQQHALVAIEDDGLCAHGETAPQAPVALQRLDEDWIGRHLRSDVREAHCCAHFVATADLASRDKAATHSPPCPPRSPSLTSPTCTWGPSPASHRAIGT